MNIEAALERKAADGHITDDHNDRDDDHDQGREHSVTAGEYVRLGLMALVIVASLTGWWRHWMLRDWLACTATLVGGFPISRRRGRICASVMDSSIVMRFLCSSPRWSKATRLAVGGV